MAGITPATPDQTVTIGPWPVGINNRAPDYSVPEGALRNAVNVDIDNLGRTRTRRGATLRLAAVGAHSLFSCPLGTFFVQQGALMRFNSNNTSTRLGNVGNNRMVYQYTNGEVYWSNGSSLGRITSAGVLGTWGETSATLSDADMLASNFDKYPEVYGPPLPCTVMWYWMGRMWMGVGPILWYTEPYALHRVKYQKNFIPFPKQIQIIAPVVDGLWVATTDETYFLPGTDPAQMTAILNLNYGAVWGTAVGVPNSNDVMWRSTRGAVLATEGGQVKNFVEDHAVANPAEIGAAIIREQDGLRQFISTAVPTGSSPMVASSWAEAEIIRKSS